MVDRYAGYSLDWANGRLAWAMEALDHIDKHGLLPVDGRPQTLKTDLPAICAVLGKSAELNPRVQRIVSALEKWNLR